MSRIYLVVLSALFGIFVVSTEVQAGKKLYVGNLPFSATDLSIVDKSTDPATDLEHVSITLTGARGGTLQNPGGTLPASSLRGIVNPGPDGFGDASFFDVFFDGPAGDFPASSFFDVFFDITDPITGLPGAMQKGTVKFFNEAKGFRTEEPVRMAGREVIISHPITGEIDPAQLGLSFSDVQLLQPDPFDPNANSFFDVFTELHFDGSTPINPALPLFRITMTATTVPEPPSVIVGLFGAAMIIVAARRWRKVIGP